MKYLVDILWSVGQNSKIDGVGGDSEIGKAKPWLYSQAKLSKFKNMIKSDFLAKFKLSVRPRSRLYFLTSRARLAFVELRQVFIELPILYYFDPKYYLWFEINKSNYAISRILSQLILHNSDK